MNKIGIIGYGELGKQVEHLLMSSSNKFSFQYFDDNAFSNSVLNAFPFYSYLDKKFKDLEFYVTIGYKHLCIKEKIILELISNNLRLGIYTHPTAYIDSTVSIDLGTIVYPNVTIDKNVKIGKGCLLNLAVTIAHDCVIGNCCFLAPSVTFSGFVKLEDNVFIGTGVSVSNNIEIKKNAVVGIGSVITRNVDTNQHIIGNPQRIVQNISL